MHTVRPAAPRLQGMVPYDPKSLPAQVFISANESPYDVPQGVRAAVCSRLEELAFNRYPDPLANELRDALAAFHGLQRGNVLCGNGGDELLFDLALAWGGPGRTLLTFPPTFSVYETNAQLTGAQVVSIPREGEDYHVNVDAAVARLSAGDVDLVILTSPNNPTGCATPLEDVRRILEATDALVLVDEAYGEFAPQLTARPLMDEFDNLLILHTFSKAYACAGVRLGYLLGAEQVITEFLKVRQPYSVDSVSQAIGLAVCEHRTLFEPQVDAILAERATLAAGLAALPGVRVHPSDANFLLVELPNAAQVWERLYAEHSILVRNVGGDPLLGGCLRITVGTPEENAALLTALASVL